MDLHRKTILVTGGRRVGQVVAEELASAGADIVMTYRKSRDEIAQEIDHLKAKHRKMRAGAYPVDLAVPHMVEQLVSAVTKDFSRVDALVNMASVFLPDPSEVTADTLRECAAITEGSMLLSRRFAEAAKRRRVKVAPIVSFIDWAVDHPYGGHDLYLAEKARLRHYLMALQISFAGTIRVVNIHPGMILEPPDFPAAEKRKIVANTPTKTIGDPQQAARLVRVALENDFMVGNVHLDGGQHWRHRL